MTPHTLFQARKRLGLSLIEMARLLGYEGEQARSQAHHGNRHPSLEVADQVL